MDFYTYILKCSDESYYVGHTDNIEKRISQHNANEDVCYTSSRLSVHIVFTQTFATRDEAFNAERQIKKWNRQKKEALIAGDWEKVSLSAKKKFPKKNSSFDTFFSAKAAKNTQDEREEE